jgi:hypothetical protein
VGFEDVSRGSKFAGLVNVNLDEVVWRWVRAFHAALYQAALPASALRAIETPFPKALVRSGAEAQLSFDRKSHVQRVIALKANRQAGRLDRISAYNGRVLYECVWIPVEGAWQCVFGLNVHDWKVLGDVNNFEPRGCAGSYIASKPDAASVAISLMVPVRNREPLDPFGSE